MFGDMGEKTSLYTYIKRYGFRNVVIEIQEVDGS